MDIPTAPQPGARFPDPVTRARLEFTSSSLGRLRVPPPQPPSPLTPSDIFPDRCWFDELLDFMLGEGRPARSTRHLKTSLFLVLAISVYTITVPRAVGEWFFFLQVCN